ncbi:class I SAM-dependent methyltransferase [Streptomyces sp. NBC_00457]|uniref:class I SAM-dependent methyltransferase n=1 Tax=Streptomyces sp. NBC_00457 TaxID=2975748 RepID=UPI002E1B0D89
MSRYLFDNTDARTPDRFSTLESCYDRVSRRQLELTGLAPGFRCLEVGGGGGSLGAWMGERVGPEGEVTVTDLDPRWAESRPRPPQVRLLRHDIVNDPLPGGDYDVIHARLVLLHLPERIAVLERLVAALRPGGWLLLEEFAARGFRFSRPRMRLPPPCSPTSRPRCWPSWRRRAPMWRGDAGCLRR